MIHSLPDGVKSMSQRLELFKYLQPTTSSPSSTDIDSLHLIYVFLTMCSNRKCHGKSSWQQHFEDRQSSYRREYAEKQRLIREGNSNDQNTPAGPPSQPRPAPPPEPELDRGKAPAQPRTGQRHCLIDGHQYAPLSPADVKARESKDSMMRARIKQHCDWCCKVGLEAGEMQKCEDPRCGLVVCGGCTNR